MEVTGYIFIMTARPIKRKIFEGEKKKTGGKEDDGTEDCYKTGFSQSGGTRYLGLIFSDLIELPFQGEGYHLCFESVNL